MTFSISHRYVVYSSDFHANLSFIENIWYLGKSCLIVDSSSNMKRIESVFSVMHVVEYCSFMALVVLQ